MLSEETIERLKRIKIIEKKFESKVLTFYQNSNSDFGMIGEQTVTDFQNALNSIDPFRKLMIIADSKGGLMDAGWRIAVLVKRRQASVTVVIPEEARSAATLVAIAAENIMMLENAQLGVLDPQMDYQGQQVSALDLINCGDPVITSKANRIVDQMREYIHILLEGKLKRPDIDRVCDRFLLLDRTHASHMSSIFQDEVRELKLPVISSMDLDIRALHRLYKSSFFCEHKPSTIIEFYPF
jgi:ClpP class serine protease